MPAEKKEESQETALPSTESTEQPLIKNAAGADENKDFAQTRKKNQGQKPKKEPEPKAEKRIGAHGAPWAPVLFSASGPDSFFCFGVQLNFRPNVFSASRCSPFQLAEKV